MRICYFEELVDLVAEFLGGGGLGIWFLRLEVAVERGDDVTVYVVGPEAAEGAVLRRGRQEGMCGV